MQQPACVPNATGNIATRSATSFPWFGDTGAHSAIIVNLPPLTRGTRENEKIKRKKGKRTKGPKEKTKRKKGHENITIQNEGETHEEGKMLRERTNHGERGTQAKEGTGVQPLSYFVDSR